MSATMYNIVHRVGIRAEASAVYHALTTDEGLSTWWTQDTTGAGPVGSIIDFRFNDTVVKFEVSELVPEQLVRWKHSGDMPEDWMGTEVVFELELRNQETYVNFSHKDWQAQGNFMGHCSLKWGVFMLSLKDALEKGKGSPFPEDVHIDHGE